jgi:hypothetical protein
VYLINSADRFGEGFAGVSTTGAVSLCTHVCWQT